MKKLLAVSLVLSSVALTIVALAAPAARSTLKGSKPSWANSANYVGAANSNAQLGFRVYLGWNNASAAESLARAVSDPRSTSYRHYLTPAQFRQQFAPTANQVAQVQNWLTSQGFTLVYTPQNNHYVSAKGTVAQAQAAFGYSFPAGFTDNPDNLTSVPWTIKGHTPQDVKGAYRISGYDGTGQTVAIIDAYASPTILDDANTWSDHRGIPRFGTTGGGTFTQVVPPGVYNIPENPVQDPQGWYGEETLDVESVHGMAPNAHVVYVAGPNNYQDLDAAMNHILDNHLAQIVSNSYGFLGENLPPGYIIPFNDTLIQAAAEGIGVYFSSGDFGDETSVLGYASTDWPASSPWVTAVGGTSLAVDQNHNLDFETGWGVSSYNCKPNVPSCTRAGWQAGAGGGFSAIFPQPDYQANYGRNLAGKTGRGVPDVAALADAQTGYLVGQTQTFQSCHGSVTMYDEYRLGGTSLACPIFAGIMALSDQKANSPHGFANPFFYQNASKFRDITAINTAVARRNFVNSIDDCNGTVDRLRTFNDYSGSPTQFTATGWDDVTGLGVPNSIP